MTYAITDQYPIFADSDGTPLESGYVWIGEENKNPITNPITVYWDSALQYPAPQPIRTLGGAPNRNGSPAQLYCNQSFSILIQDREYNNVYYGKSGVKNYSNELVSENKNFLYNGNFNVWKNYPDTIDCWIEDVNTDIITFDRAWFDFGQTEVPDNPSYYISLSPTTSQNADAYSRFVAYIENVSLLANKTVTLSFFAKQTEHDKFAVSFTQRFFNPANDVEGIAPNIFYPTNDWKLYYLTTTLPDISFLTYPFELNLPWFNTCLFVNFWLSTGTDYDDQTGGLGYTPSGGVLYLADVRLNLGTTRILDYRTYEQDQKLVERYIETSYSVYAPIKGAPSQDNGAELILADSIADDIVGFKYRTIKRVFNPTITIYDAQTGNAGYVNRLGTGQIQVDDVVFPNDARVPRIALLTPTVAGSYYQYHWAVDAQFTI